MPTRPQISRFLLSLDSFSLPVDFINRATPKTKIKKAAAPKSGIILSPMVINKFMTPLTPCDVSIFYDCNWPIVAVITCEIAQAPKSMAAPMTAQVKALLASPIFVSLPLAVT